MRPVMVLRPSKTLFKMTMAGPVRRRSQRLTQDRADRDSDSRVAVCRIEAGSCRFSGLFWPSIFGTTLAFQAAVTTGGYDGQATFFSGSQAAISDVHAPNHPHRCLASGAWGRLWVVHRHQQLSKLGLPSSAIVDACWHGFLEHPSPALRNGAHRVGRSGNALCHGNQYDCLPGQLRRCTEECDRLRIWLSRLRWWRCRTPVFLGHHGR